MVQAHGGQASRRRPSSSVGGTRPRRVLASSCRDRLGSAALWDTDGGGASTVSLFIATGEATSVHTLVQTTLRPKVRLQFSLWCTRGRKTTGLRGLRRTMHYHLGCMTA
eukprot:CAMPEP_0174351082 /NCGR_PEP_ID=MMETSP0811_2-20130205/8313_1 /TAXON_ID=73025 ORGANISM="Eutreptiella gymnastica-like, Strain CCMP1594" /NCGR_SAMPLE_ID=MMETSP0811_2 /ASSEMBLY_ACC=CAM_ASM_000667 /LENGTH=108 /DNA_ID=CAMNT_0015479953 /DNA_START=497 /DNA_END=823 /DNA_ORIENTATION=-